MIRNERMCLSTGMGLEIGTDRNVKQVKWKRRKQGKDKVKMEWNEKREKDQYRK